MGLPLLPKTPEYVLRRSAKAQEDLKRFSLDASIAASGSSVISRLGLSQFDLSMKGPIDYTDPLNPIFSWNIALSKDFDMDIKYKDKIAYFKVNQVPSFLKSYLIFYGFDDTTLSQFINKWFKYASKTLDTEARANLETQKTEMTPEEVSKKTLMTLSDERVKKQITMTDDTVDGIAAYKIHINATSEVLDIIEKNFSIEKDTDFNKTKVRVSQYIDQMLVDMWISKADYYSRKISASFKIKPYNSSAILMPSTGDTYNGSYAQPSVSEPIPVSVVMKFSDFGKPVSIDIPSDAVNVEDFMQNVMLQRYQKQGTLPNGSSSFTPVTLPYAQGGQSASSQARDATRQTEVKSLATALYEYKRRNGVFPPGIPTTIVGISKKEADICKYLVPSIIAALPIDSKLGGGYVSDCSSNYNTGYDIWQSKITGKVTIAAYYTEGPTTIQTSL